MSPQTEGEGGRHIAFGAFPISIRVASCLHSILNHWVDFGQTCTDTLLGGGKK